MRRLYALVAGVGMVATTGCYHVAGKCDCVPPVQPCCIYGLYPAGYGYSVVTQNAATTTSAEAVDAKPKAE